MRTTPVRSITLFVSSLFFASSLPTAVSGYASTGYLLLLAAYVVLAVGVFIKRM